MCGIVGYIGKKEAAPILIEGLKRLEYRGYDSAGICVLSKGSVKVIKKSGAVENLEKEINQKQIKGNLGIAHTRWATHGIPNEKNAHPHSDCNESIFIVHNGIIENFAELKEALEREGHIFKSKTDTEVIVHLIERSMEESPSFDKPLENAVADVLRFLRGTYGLAVVSSYCPDRIIAARKGSPLAIGVGDDEYILASDVSAIIPYTQKVIYLDDGEIAVLKSSGLEVFRGESIIQKPMQQIKWNIEDSQKGGYPHFMIKEINEAPTVVGNAIRGRIIVKDGNAKLGGLEQIDDKLRKINRLIIIACGTSYYAGLVGEYMIEEYAGIPCEVEFASEFRYRKPIITENTAVLVISQSGETADTLEALREAKRKGALTLAIVNVVGSTIAREADAGIYNYAGQEISVASTKAFISQLSVLALLTLFLGRQKALSLVMGMRIAKEIFKLPALIKEVLRQDQLIKKIAKKYYKYDKFLFIGRKYNYPVALEGALKLKEISYVHAEGYSAGEMKHGPIALIDKDFPSLAIAPKDSVYEKIMSNIQEIKARNGVVVAITTKNNIEIKKFANDAIYIPKTLEMLTPIIAVIPLQLFAYYIAVFRGTNVDKPRNLAKSVTVE